MKTLYNLVQHASAVFSNWKTVSARIGATFIGVFVMVNLLSVNTAQGQLNIAAANTNYTIDFEGTVTGVLNGTLSIPTNTGIFPTYLQDMDGAGAGALVTVYTGGGPHGLSNGAQVLVAGATSANFNSSPLTTPYTISGVVATPTAVGTTTALTRTLTVVTATVANSLVVGDIITMAGATAGTFNGTFKVTSASGTQFTYNTTTSGSLTATVQGTVTKPASFQYTAAVNPAADATANGTIQNFATAVLGQTTPGVGQLNSNGIKFINTPIANIATATAHAFGGLNLQTTSTNGGTFANSGITSLISSSGYFNFNVGSVGGGPVTNTTLGFQPTGTFFGTSTTQGSAIVLQLTNNTGATITALNVSYKIYEYNDQGRSTTIGLSHGNNVAAYTNVPAASWTNATAAATSPVANTAYVMNFVTGRITGISVLNGANYFLKIYGVDNAGGGSRDEFALDDITVSATATAPAVSISLPGPTAVTNNATQTFPSTVVSSSNDLVFTLANTGGAGYLSQPIFSGTNAAEYSIFGTWPSQVTGGETFTVRFTPTGTGTRTALLKFNNNDGTGIANPFNINLSGPATSTLPTVDLTVTANAGAEAGSPTVITVTATTSGGLPLLSPVTMNIAVTGSPLTASRYSLASGTIVIPAGASPQTNSTTFTITNDLIREGSETATLTMSTVDPAVVLGNTVENIVITDPIDDVVSIAALATNYTEDFNNLAISGTAHKNVPQGTYFGGSALPTTYNTDNGTANSNSILSLGVTADPNRSLGAVNSALSTTRWGLRYKNNTGSAISSLKVSYLGKQWRDNNTLAQTASFEYQVGATVSNINGGAWTGVSDLDFVSPSILGSPVIVNGNTAPYQTQFTDVAFNVAIPAGQEIMIRWNFILSGGGSSHTLATDDVVFQASSFTIGTIATPTSASITTTTAVLGADMTSTGTGAFTSKGIVWGLAANALSNTVPVAGAGTGVFTTPVTGLPPGTLIYYRGFVTNAAGTAYTTVATFNSVPLPVVKTWNNAAGGAWTTGANWTPAGAPANSDYIVFDAAGSPTYTVTNTPTLSVQSILVAGGDNVTLTATGTVTLTISGTTGTDFSIPVGTSFSLAGANPIGVQLGASATGSISGNVTLDGGAHTLKANITGSPNTNLIQFLSGSIFTQESAATGSAFGTTTGLQQNSVLFKNGSSFVQNGGANPFGLTAPNSVLTFEDNSTFTSGATTAPTISARTFGNFVLNAPTVTYSFVAGGTFTCNNFTVNACAAGGVNMGQTGTMLIKGSITNNTANPLTFNPGSSSTLALGTNPSISFSGSGAGAVSTGANCLVTLSSGSVLTLNRNITFGGGFTNGGTTNLNAFDLTINGALGGSGTIYGNILSSLNLGAATTGALFISNLNNSFKAITSNSASTVTINNDVKVYDVVTISAGTLSFSNLILKSNISGTARIGNSAGAISGNITAERYIPTVGWHFIGTSLAGQTVADWNDDMYTFGPMPGVQVPNPGSNTSSIFLYNEANVLNDGLGQVNGWEVPTSSAITQNVGYRVFSPVTAVVLDNTGTYSTGTKNIPLSFTAGANPGYNLIMNPHLSPIDWTNGTITKTNIQAGALIYNPISAQYEYIGSAIGGVPTNAGNTIASGQAFMVRATSGGASVSITEASKVASATFHRTSVDESNRIRISFKDAGSAASDEALFKFMDGTTAEYDPELDAEKFENAGMNVYTISPEYKQMAINGLPFTGVQMVIPVGVKAAAGSYSFSIGGLENLTISSNVYFRDFETGALVNLATNPVYNFILSETGTVNNRFELIFTPFTVTEVKASLADAMRIFPNPASDATFNVVVDKEQTGSAELWIENIAGQRVSSQTLTLGLSKSNSFSVAKPASAGIYVVKMRVNGKMLNQKLVVQ